MSDKVRPSAMVRNGVGVSRIASSVPCPRSKLIVRFRLPSAVVINPLKAIPRSTNRK